MTRLVLEQTRFDTDLKSGIINIEYISIADSILIVQRRS